MAMCGRADRGMGALVTGNNDGSVVIQVEAVGRAGVAGQRPFIDSPMLGWNKILPWIDSWGIPRTFPAGPPMPYPASYGNNGNRPQGTWDTQSGWYAHSQVPGNDHGDPGIVDLAKVFNGQPSEEEDYMAAMPEVDTNHDLLMTHPNVRTLQALLGARGGWILMTNTNRQNLINVLRWAQVQYHLTSDGICGPLTWQALTKPLNGK